MKNSTDTEPNIHVASEEPDLPEIKKELTNALDGAAEFFDRAEHNLDVRYCMWEGQTRDGRKHGTTREAPFPWENASDARIRTVDLVINEKVDLLLLALGRMNIQVMPTQAREADWGNRMAALLRWYLHNAMADEADGEIELLANYFLTYGSAVLSVGWLQMLAYELQTVRLEDLAQKAQEMGGAKMVAAIAVMLTDPAQKDTVMGYVKKFSTMLTDREARKVIEDLMTAGEATFPRPYLQDSRPTLRALQTMQDVVFPPGTWRLQKARFIGERELLTETELREKAEGREGWDADFVDYVLEHSKGDMFNASPAAQQIIEKQRSLGGVWGERWNEADDLYEVWHFFHRASLRGIPAIFRTVMHPGCDEYYGLHEVLNYAHGEYPHVEFVRERHVRSIIASRGLPEVLDTQQSEIKVQRDARTDRASLTTMPPIKAKKRAGQEQHTYGPGVEIPVTRSEDVEVLQFGPPDLTSIEVEKASKHDVNEYAGRPGEGIDPQLVVNATQGLATRWVRRWNVAGRQMLCLAQQYTPQMTVARVVGLIPKPFQVTRENIAGSFGMMLSFDVRFADADFVFSLLERIEKYVLPMDSNAVVNRDALIRYGMSAIDPTLADLAVRDSESAQQSEVEDELNNITLMVAGVEPPMKLKGQNHAARLEVMQAAMTRNQPFFNALVSTRPDFSAMLQRRVEFLQQQVEQQKNKMIGVYGTDPAPGSPGTGPMGTAGGAMVQEGRAA